MGSLFRIECSALQAGQQRLCFVCPAPRGVDISPQKCFVRDALGLGRCLARLRLRPSRRTPWIGSASLEAALFCPASGGARRLEGRVQKLASDAKISGLRDVSPRRRRGKTTLPLARQSQTTRFFLTV